MQPDSGHLMPSPPDSKDQSLSPFGPFLENVDAFSVKAQTRLPALLTIAFNEFSG